MLNKSKLDKPVTKAEIDALGVDHGALSGREDDDHSLYHTDGRGDARYFTQAQLGSTLQDHESGADLIGIPIIAGATNTTLHEFVNLFGSAGQSTGGEITQGAGETINVAAGTGFIKATDVDTAELLSFNWAASNGIAIPTNTIRYIGVGYGTPPAIVVKETYVWDLDTEFPLGVVSNIDGILHIINNPWRVTDGLTNVIERFDGISKISRDEFIGGLVVGESGDNNRDVTLSSGTLWSRLNKYLIADLNTAIAGDFHTLYRASPSGWVSTEGVTEWPNTHYDDGSGTLAELSNNWYMNLWWYILNTGKLHIIYGQAQYANAAVAEAEAPPSSIPRVLYETGMLIGRFIIKGGVVIAHQIQTVWETQFTATQATDHGNLVGLGDDDHTQYVLTTGARAMEELRLTPKSSSDSVVEGTVFYCSDDNHIYVGTE